MLAGSLARTIAASGMATMKSCFVTNWDKKKRPAQLIPEDRQKILAALSNVFHTPQASGIPTNSQSSAALASSPPLPMPNEPCWIAPLLALAACSLATSASLRLKKRLLYSARPASGTKR
jgi:hypothetical protein